MGGVVGVGMVHLFVLLFIILIAVQHHLGVHYGDVEV